MAASNFLFSKFHSIIFFILTVVLFTLTNSCDNDYIPKPRAYFRIDLPEKQYIRLDSMYPYSFEYPVYAEVVPDTLSYSGKYWINLHFPAFKGIMHISYKEVNDNLLSYLEDSRNLVVKHIPKANAINEVLYINDDSKVYGLLYEIEGSSAASPYQFYVTDSVNHFVRGSLYFYVTPNNDS